MAGHDVSAKVAELLAGGWTYDEINAAVTDITGGSTWTGQWVSERSHEINGRRAEAAINSLRPKVERVSIDEVPVQAGPLATDRQVDYITALIARRVRDGEGGGFVSVDRYVSGGSIDVAALRQLTRSQASEMITSLKGDY